MKKTKQSIERFLGCEIQRNQKISLMGGLGNTDPSDPVTPSRGGSSGTIWDGTYPPPPVDPTDG